MKIIIAVIICFLSITTYAQKRNPYATLKFNKVVMYDFEPSGSKGGSIVEEDGRLTKNINKQTPLDKATISLLNEKLVTKASFHWGTAACFDPHLGFVYYSGNRILGYITICLDCNRLSANLKLPAQIRLKEGEDAHGMSKSLRQFLNGLLKKYNFSHQILTGSTFDK
jgi:hypothetical protein